MKQRRPRGLSSTLVQFGAIAATALLTTPAHSAELQLAEPAPCVTRDELSFRVERLLGEPLSSVDGMDVSVRIESASNGFGATLVVSRPGTPQGTRVLRAPSCERLSESLALAIVVAIGAAEQVPAPAEPRVIPLVASEPAAVPSAPDAAPEQPGGGPAFAGSAWMLGDTGSLPAPGLGVGLALDVAWTSLALRATGTLLPERIGTIRGTDPSAPGVSIGLLAGGGLVCLPVALEDSVLSLDACAGWELGQLSGSGVHVSSPYQRRTLWSAARFEVVGSWAVPHTALALELLVAAVAPLTREDFILKDIGSVHRPANVAGRVGLGVSLAIGP